MVYIRPLADNVIEIAEPQFGRITRRQLLAGVDAERIKRWLADGRLRRLHHGVYALGHVSTSPRGEYMAAVLASGSGAHLSHDPAAFLCRVIRGDPPPPEVTIPGTAGRRRPGITVHRSALHRLDTFKLDGIPITSVPRILLDLAPRLTPEDLTRACHEAWLHHRTRPWHGEDCIARNPRKPGIGKLRAALGSDVTLSRLESTFLRLLATHRLARPRTNIDHSGDKVDCHWPDLGLTIELLSYRYHATRHACEADAARRRRSQHMAYTWGDVTDRGARTAAEVAALLRARAA